MFALKLITFTKHLDTGYGKPVCSPYGEGRTIKWGEGNFNCPDCAKKVNIARLKQARIEELNRSEFEIRNKLYSNNNKPRLLEVKEEAALKRKMREIESERKKILAGINTVESDLMLEITAQKNYGVA